MTTATASVPTATAANTVRKPAAKPAPAPAPIPASGQLIGQPSAVDPTAVAARGLLHDIEVELNGTFAERQREVRGIITAIVAGEHILLLGPAGTGKSALAQTVCAAIDGGQYFEWLLTRFSTPEELFGPVSLDGLKHDKFRRITSGKLPEAHVAFLDEIFKANSAVLNSLLTALNERAFDNDGGRIAIPLETCVGASNELPEGPELAALFDRFLLRFWTTYTRGAPAFERLLCGDEPNITTRITLVEIAAAQDDAAKVAIPTATVEELFKLRMELESKGIIISDRRWRKAAKVLRATAWLEGATEVTPDTFPVLAHVLWDQVQQQQEIAGMVARYTSTELAEAQEIHDKIVELCQELPKDEDPDFAKRVTGVTREMKQAQARIAAQAKAATKPAIKAKIEAIAAELDRRYQTIRERTVKAMGL